MKNISYTSSTTAASNFVGERIPSCFITRLTLAAIALVLFTLPIAGHACCGIGPQYPDFHDDSPSQNDPYTLGPFVTAYDNFFTNGSGVVNHVTWWGSYSNPSSQAPILGFTIDFFSSSGNAPGSLLSSLSIAGNANETFVQYDDLGDPTYQYDAALTLSLAAGTEYWMSIVPDLAYPPQWGWETSSQGDGQSYHCTPASCGYVQSDLAFSFPQQATPEPGSLALLGSGVLGLSGLLRRRLRG